MLAELGISTEEFKVIIDSTSTDEEVLALVEQQRERAS